MTDLESVAMNAGEVYRIVVWYIEAHGFKRIQPDEAWWWDNSDGSEKTFGEALEEALDQAGVDMRSQP